MWLAIAMLVAHASATCKGKRIVKLQSMRAGARGARSKYLYIYLFYMRFETNASGQPLRQTIVLTKSSTHKSSPSLYFLCSRSYVAHITLLHNGRIKLCRSSRTYCSCFWQHLPWAAVQLRVAACQSHRSPQRQQRQQRPDQPVLLLRLHGGQLRPGQPGQAMVCQQLWWMRCLPKPVIPCG